MEKEIQSKFNSGISQQNPTPRRLRIAESMREDGHRLQLAQAVLRVAAAKARGEDTPLKKAILDATGVYTLPTTKKAALEFVRDWHGAIKDAMLAAGQAPKGESVEDKIRVAINELCGNKIPGFFPTPDNIADRMVELADFPPGLCRLLEPSAGYGALIDAAVRKQGDGRLEITCHEVNHRLAAILEMKGYTVAEETDFIESFGPERFDRVLMNPPFEKGQDMMHTMAAFDKLAPGGVLVGVVCENCFYRNDGDYPLFREWLEDLGAEVFELPSGAFTGTIRTTDVKTSIIKVCKPKK